MTREDTEQRIASSAYAIRVLAEVLIGIEADRESVEEAAEWWTANHRGGLHEAIRQLAAQACADAEWLGKQHEG